MLNEQIVFVDKNHWQMNSFKDSDSIWFYIFEIAKNFITTFWINQNCKKRRTAASKKHWFICATNVHLYFNVSCIIQLVNKMNHVSNLLFSIHQIQCIIFEAIWMCYNDNVMIHSLCIASFLLFFKLEFHYFKWLHSLYSHFMIFLHWIKFYLNQNSWLRNSECIFLFLYRQ